MKTGKAKYPTLFLTALLLNAAEGMLEAFFLRIGQVNHQYKRIQLASKTNSLNRRFERHTHQSSGTGR